MSVFVNSAIIRLHHVHGVAAAYCYRCSMLCQSVYVTAVSPAKMAELIEVAFVMWTHRA